jgi:ankyrin repeat protein
MFGYGRLPGVAVLAIALTALVSCRKPAETVKSDLEEAGYHLTAADWFRASRSNDAPALKKFIAAGFAVDTRDEAGDSALHAAAAADAQSAAKYLLDRGLSVDLRGAQDRTPLMSAVLGDKSSMVRWLLRQGADPRARDKEGFSPLLLAVSKGKAGPVAELAPYQREILDSALLLAALTGQTKVIDTLTNYGASVYARMEDGRTALMIAAENGHTESVKLLLDLGASRFTTDSTGRTAADLAFNASHPEIAALIARDPLPAELTLESPAEIAKSMDAAVARSSAKKPPSISPPIQGEVLSHTVAVDDADEDSVASHTPPTVTGKGKFPLPAIAMRLYREREMPIQVRSVEGKTAKLNINGSAPHEIQVHPGDMIPGSRLIVLHVERRMENSKVNLGKPNEVSVVEVHDTATGTNREWISGVPSNAHDPVALIEDTSTGKRYTASPGQRFTSADGAKFIISDVRPNQIVIKDTATGATQTLPLRGPRG